MNLHLVSLQYIPTEVAYTMETKGRMLSLRVRVDAYKYISVPPILLHLVIVGARYVSYADTALPCSQITLQSLAGAGMTPQAAKHPPAAQAAITFYTPNRHSASLQVRPSILSTVSS